MLLVFAKIHFFSHMNNFFCRRSVPNKFDTIMTIIKDQENLNSTNKRHRAGPVG